MPDTQVCGHTSPIGRRTTAIAVCVLRVHPDHDYHQTATGERWGYFHFQILAHDPYPQDHARERLQDFAEARRFYDPEQMRQDVRTLLNTQEPTPDA